MARARKAVAAAAILVASASAARADEGQWTPEQIAELDRRELARLGLSLAPEALWNARDGGLMRAAANFGGCSAGFVSPDGLVATNYHCAYGAIQAHATAERDYLTEGFVARSRREELPIWGGRGTLEVLLSIEDVSAEMLAAAARARDDAARHRALERKEKEIVARCEARDKGRRCRVASFYLGKIYRLFESLELRDVRVVYAPPAGVGEFGGDVDNWMWPRHTGDFALVRAYTAPDGQSADHAPNNVPYRPRTWLRVSPRGVSRGDFVAVMGYPANTDRYLSAAEVVRHVEQVLPARAALYGEWVALLEAQAQRSKEVAIRVAAVKKSLANREKNARGMLAGIARMDLVARRKNEDAALRARRDGGVLAELDRLSDLERRAFPRDFLLDAVYRGPALLSVALDLVRRAREHAKPDLERAEPYMERNAPALKKTLVRRLKSFDSEVEAHLISSLVEHAQRIELRISAFDHLQELADRQRESVLDHVRSRVEASKLDEAARIEQLFDEAELTSLEALEDPIVQIALELAPIVEQSEHDADARRGMGARLGPAYFELLAQAKSGPLYPDANRTLRLSYATVKGYAPRDGLWATPQTTLEGQLHKHTGEAPFDLPERLRRAATQAAQTYWADPQRGDVPVCFLTNADTTGGNSGSPVVNGRGELVGLNFDRVWENIAGDFSYHPDHSRNIVADVRYMLWLLDRVEDAGTLLEEMGVTRYRTLPARSRHERPPRPPARNPIGCAASGRPVDGWAFLWLAALACATRLNARTGARNGPSGSLRRCPPKAE